MKMKWMTMFAAAAIAVCAQTTPDAPPAKKESKVGERKANQRKRVAEGVKSGELTARETAKIETKEAAINKDVRAERAANGGKLTPAERRKVNRQQNKTSKEIYREKHDAQTQPK